MLHLACKPIPSGRLHLSRWLAHVAVASICLGDKYQKVEWFFFKLWAKGKIESSCLFDFLRELVGIPLNFLKLYTLSLSSLFFISFQTAGQGWAGQDLALFMGRAGLYCTQSSNVTEPFRLASMAGLWFDSNSSQDGQERDEVTFNRLVLSWETESGRQHYSRLTRTGNNINPPEKKNTSRKRRRPSTRPCPIPYKHADDSQAATTTTHKIEKKKKKNQNRIKITRMTDISGSSLFSSFSSIYIYVRLPLLFFYPFFFFL